MEDKRGCGWRKIHGLYLCGEGLAVPCDRLPLILKECKCCGFKPAMFRGFSWINAAYIKPDHYEELRENGQRALNGSRLQCSCFVRDKIKVCPVCFPESIQNLEVDGKVLRQTRFGFMWVSKLFYSPESFIDEAKRIGVSKRTSYIPNGLKIGMWIMLAHKKAGSQGEPAIFYAYRLKRIEYLITEEEVTKENLEKIKKKGWTPVVISKKEEEKMNGV